MKFTPAQRAKIYRELAEGYDKIEYDHAACYQLNKRLKLKLFIVESTLNEFPEFALFIPLPGHYGLWWWRLDDENRVLALLFCEQMCNP